MMTTKTDSYRSLTAAVVVGAIVAASGAGVAEAKKKSRMVTVGTDKKGDWGDNAFGSGAGTLGDALGQDLIEAAIGMADSKKVHFVITVASLPPPGGAPEVTRYLWDMVVDGDGVQLDGKFTNYSRGVCDPTSGQCPPPRDPGPYPFFVRGDCKADGATVVCTERAVVQASFDAAAGAITIPVPLKLLNAQPGSRIGPTTLLYGGVTAIPAVFASAAAMPSDQLMPTKAFVVPNR